MARISVLLTLMLSVSPALADASGEAIVIAHRGASGYLPEHTLEAYAMAIDQGADYIEPDLVITKDGRLIARHENWLSTTTDVASRPQFADRKKTVGERTDWFTEDFTLAEIKTLRAVQAFPGRSIEFDGRFEVPTLEEVIELAQRKAAETGRMIGLYPETKAPSYFTGLGYDVAGLLLSSLGEYGLDEPGAPVFIQSFEPGILRELDRKTDLPLVMLVTPVSREQPHTPNIPLDDIATFADGIGAFKVLLMRQDGTSSGIIEAAHARGLAVHAWTFRDDAWPEQVFDTPEAEIEAFLDIGLDGFFTDFPDTGVRVRDRISR